MMRHSRAYTLAGDLAEDLRHTGWNRDRLRQICEEEVEEQNLYISPQELLNKVEGAYLANSKRKEG